jgi:hypothetical protein
MDGSSQNEPPKPARRTYEPPRIVSAQLFERREVFACVPRKKSVATCPLLPS